MPELYCLSKVIKVIQVRVFDWITFYLFSHALQLLRPVLAMSELNILKTRIMVSMAQMEKQKCVRKHKNPGSSVSADKKHRGAIFATQLMHLNLGTVKCDKDRAWLHPMSELMFQRWLTSTWTGSFPFPFCAKVDETGRYQYHNYLVLHHILQVSSLSLPLRHP